MADEVYNVEKVVHEKWRQWMTNHHDHGGLRPNVLVLGNSAYQCLKEVEASNACLGEVEEYRGMGVVVSCSRNLYRVDIGRVE